MTIQIATNQFKDYLVIERAYSPQTIDAYGRDLAGFSSYLLKKGLTSQVSDVSQGDIVGYLAYLASTEGGKEPNIASTRARKLASIRSFFTFLRKLATVLLFMLSTCPILPIELLFNIFRISILLAFVSLEYFIYIL